MFLLAATLLLKSATVIDGEPRVADILINGQTITCVGKCAAPKDATVIEATGKFVVPGFVDMHAHLTEHGGEPRWNRETTLRYLRLLLAHGVTTIRDPGSETEVAVMLRKMLAERKIIGPRLFTAGRILNGSDFDPEPFAPVRDADDIRREIRWQAEAGVDFIKIYSSMTPAQTKVAIDEAHARGLRVIGHLQRTTWTEAARMGIDAIAHGAPWSPEYLPPEARADYHQTMFGRVYWLEHIDLDAPVFRELTDELTTHHVVMDPTLIAYHTKFFGKTSYTSDWTDEQFAAARKAWPKQLALTTLLFDRGVLLTVGTDMPTTGIVPGESVHDEMALLVSAGIAPRDVLRMATRNAATALRAKIGAIEPGMSADLVLLTKNPLDDIRSTRSIELVIARGVRYDPTALMKPAPSSKAIAFAPSSTFTSTQSREKVETTRMSMPSPARSAETFARNPTQ